MDLEARTNFTGAAAVGDDDAVRVAVVMIGERVGVGDDACDAAVAAGLGLGMAIRSILLVVTVTVRMNQLPLFL